jgi:hypothetical protein
MYDVSFSPQSNRASFPYVGLVTDYEDNPIDISACSMVFAIREKKSGSPRLVASTENGKITYIALGVFRWFFTESEMNGLCAGTYETGLTLTPNDNPDDTRQLSVGPLPIVDGVVP